MDVPEETIRQWPEFSYFSAAGFLYYLPKLMFVALNHRLDPSFTEVIESLFYALTITGKYDEKQRLNFDTLSIPQKHCVAQFLNYFAEGFPEVCRVLGAEEALNGYWIQFTRLPDR